MEDFEIVAKARKVIDSCETMEQANIAKIYVRLARGLMRAHLMGVDITLHMTAKAEFIYAKEHGLPC